MRSNLPNWLASPHCWFGAMVFIAVVGLLCRPRGISCRRSMADDDRPVFVLSTTSRSDILRCVLVVFPVLVVANWKSRRKQ